MKKVIIVSILFFLDRISKVYLIHLQEIGTNIDFYILPFLNFFLAWNTGVGFGIMSLEANIYYHILTIIIAIINVVLIYYLFKVRGIQIYFVALIIGGSLGNLFDRIYYYAVPDFIDFHIGNYHWFIFNFADIFITTGIIGIVMLEFLKNKNRETNV